MFAGLSYNKSYYNNCLKDLTFGNMLVLISIFFSEILIEGDVRSTLYFRTGSVFCSSENLIEIAKVEKIVTGTFNQRTFYISFFVLF